MVAADDSVRQSASSLARPRNSTPGRTRPMPQLTLGLPKGSLEATTLELFRKSGWKISGADRSYFPSVDDDTLRCVLARPQEMSRYVEDGVLDAGITGKDWTLENDSDVHVVCDFVYSKASMRPTRWVVVVPQASPITEISQLHGKRIATEMVGFTKRYFSRAQDRRRRRVLLGRHRGQGGPGPGRRHRRGDGDRQHHSRQRAARSSTSSASRTRSWSPTAAPGPIPGSARRSSRSRCCSTAPCRPRPRSA